MKCQVAEIQWGGGVVAEIFCDLRKPSRFSGGGSSRIFPWSPNAVAIQWGGGSSRIFPWSPNAGAIQWGGGSSRIFALPPKASAISVGEG